MRSILKLATLLAFAVQSESLLRLAEAAPEGTEPKIVNPYARVDWNQVEYLHSLSHQHGKDPQVFWDMGYRHLPLSNYYPSQPLYPLPAAFLQKHPEALGGPNAEQHSTTDSGLHFNALGSHYSTGYGKTPDVKLDASPVEYEFSDLNVFDAQNSPWLGVYRLDLGIGARPGANQEAAVSLTIEGATEVNHKTFVARGDGIVRERRLGAASKAAVYFKTESDKVRVRLEFNPMSTQITGFRLMQGTNRPWRDAFRASLDGTLKDSAERPIEGLLFPDGGGITINHPGGPLNSYLEMLDFDPRVLGIEVWNDRSAFGRVQSGYYRLWDEVLRTGRPCFGFFVKDHGTYGRGRNVLLVSTPPEATRPQREHEALRAYREGRFFGLVGAMAVDESGKTAPPYDNSDFRFTRIALKKNSAGAPDGVEVSVGGADRSKRPNTQIRFVTEEGIAHVAHADQAYFAFPRDAAGAIRCRFVRVEAFAYPKTHLGGRPLTAEALTSMSVHDIARIHDRLGDVSLSWFEPAGQQPIPIVDLIFSQPILLGQRTEKEASTKLPTSR